MVEITKLISTLLLLALIVLAENSAAGLDESRVISASEIFSKIENGEPVTYTNVAIIGDMDMRVINPNASYSIRAPIEIKNSLIYGKVNFDDAILQDSVDFTNSEFLEIASFNKTLFLKGAKFMDCQFNRNVLFLGSKFNDTTFFYNATFMGFANFLASKFEGKRAEFARSQFKGNANFDSVEFGAQIVNFQGSKFFRRAVFQNAVFDGSSDFRGTQFHEYADFRFAQFNRPSDLNGVEFSKEVDFNWITFGSLYIRWDSLSGKLICNGPIYMNLIKNFKELEQFDDADDCYYEYREWRRTTRPLEWAKFFDYLAWLSCGYGVRWQNTLLSGIMVVILFGLYYESYNLKNAMLNVFHREHPKNTCKYEFKEKFKRSISFSAITLLSLPSEWFPFGKEEYQKFVEHHVSCAIIERMIGWGLMLLLIGTLSRLMVRY